MAERTRRRSSSIYCMRPQPAKNVNVLRRNVRIFGIFITIGNIIACIVSVVLVTVHCVAVFTPHWKEFSPNAETLSLKDLDPLVKKEADEYFNIIQNSNYHSYGLFQRCEHRANAIKSIDNSPSNVRSRLLNSKTVCRKNFLPSYPDDKFNECHSLAYYLYCTQANHEIVDIHSTFQSKLPNAVPRPINKITPGSACPCLYPTYVIFCQWFSILAMILLSITALLSFLFPFLKEKQNRLTVKCFVILASLLATLCLFIYIIIAFIHMMDEPLEYLASIEKHYRSEQIYKLSSDTRITIDHLIHSLNTSIGYSMILAWSTLFLSIVNSLLLMISCRIKPHDETKAHHFSPIVSEKLEDSQGKTTDASIRNPFEYPDCLRNDGDINPEQSGDPLLPEYHVETKHNTKHRVSFENEV